MKLVTRHAASAPDHREEQLVDPVDLTLHDLALLLGVRDVVAADRGVLAERDSLAVRVDLLPKTPSDQLPAKHADRAGESAGARHDPAPRRRHPVAA